MEDSRAKRTAETNREKLKKKNAQEKKTKSETTTFSTGSSVTDPSLESIVVVGKGCSYGRSKLQDSGYRLHECYSEAAINLVPESSKNLMDIVCAEGLHPVASTTSFLSAKSDVSDVHHKRIYELEDMLQSQNLIIYCLKKQLGDKELVGVKSVSTETDINLGDIEEFKLRLKDLEKKVISKEKKIKDLNLKLDDSAKVRETLSRENKRLSHQVNLLNRQLKSMFELLGTKKWNSQTDPAEIAKFKNKAAELESLLESKEEEKNELLKKTESLSASLEEKEKELSMKCKELIDFKNKSTLEMCKLITQIDTLQAEAKSKSQVLESKIAEAQNSLDDEIVSITQKLEERYQKDMNSAIEKFQKDFEKLSELPKSAIEKLLQFCEPEKIDLIDFQNEWDKQRSMLEAKIEAIQADRNKEITQIKDSYESKIIFLKTQVEALSSQLKERKEIIDIFESELLEYKSNSSMNLLKASTLGDDISSLKELYTAELFSQKQVHKLQMDIFEEKVKTLTDEILYHAKTEEIQLQELENAKKMAFAFREKFEQLVLEWEEKVEKDLKPEPSGGDILPELDKMIYEFKNLMQSLKQSEETHERRINKLESRTDDERLSLLQDIETMKNKLDDLRKFQKTQMQMDETIQELIQTVGVSYTKTVESLLLSHATELSLKQVEMCASEKRHIEEIDILKNEHEIELEELRNKVKLLEESKPSAGIEMDWTCLGDNVALETLKKRIEELTAENLKLEGMMAVKEETETALNNRIKQLEDIIRSKEEDCHEKIEDLTANYLKIHALSSAKEELTKELEEKLNDSEKLLEKSYEEIERLSELCSRFGKNVESDALNVGDFCGSRDKFKNAKASGERLRIQLVEAMQELEECDEMKRKMEEQSGGENTQLALKNSLTLAAEKNALLEAEKNKILNENYQMKKEIGSLVEKMTKTKKILEELDSHKTELSELRKKLEQLENEKSEIQEKLTIENQEVLELKGKLQELENENSEILLREQRAKDEKLEILERNEVLEGSVRDLSEKIDMLMELAEKKEADGDGVFSISVKEVRLLYEEERDLEVIESPSTSNSACQTILPAGDITSLWKTNEELKKENDELRSELSEREARSRVALHNEMISKISNIQRELSQVVSERDRLAAISETLAEEKESLKEEMETLRIENYAMKVIAEKGMNMDEPGMAEMNRKVERLSDYVRTLTTKLDMMRASNEILLSESHEHLRHNQDLVSELEEAWSQRYEIEDQLTRVRKENALLNLHRKQLEETNRRISSLVAEGKPSVVSWIKIHETVESIVDEVLTLKSSFSDFGSNSSTTVNIARTPSELKIMSDTLHAQLKNKTLLCDELIIQKETLEKELKNLEVLMRESGCSRKRHSESRQPGTCSSEKRPALDWRTSGCQSSDVGESSPLSTLNRLKRNLADQAELKEAQFRENLKLDIKELKKEMAGEEESGRKGSSGDDGEKCLKAMEAEYEDEVMELTKEFEAEVEKLKEAYGPEKEGESFRENYAEEIDKLRSYFERKWANLEKRYTESCKAQKLKRLNRGSIPEANDILQQLGKILQEETPEAERKSKVESLLKEMITRHENEVKSLREKYEEAVVLLERRHNSEVQKLQAVVLEVKENILVALKNEKGGSGDAQLDDLNNRQEKLIASVRAEYEAKLEEEKKRLCDLLEETKQRHEREILALEEFWTEKLSECETRCAIMKATRKTKAKNQGEAEEETENREPDQPSSERNEPEERENYTEDNQQFGAYPSDLQIKNDNLCVSCLSKRSIFGEMEVKTDDDKLDVMLQRDKLEEMVTSMRNIITKLLVFIGQHKQDLSNVSFDIDDTMYKSIHLDLDKTISEVSMTSNSVLMDLSSVFQEIKENSLLNSSDQVRFELDRCLQQLKKDATCLLALSCPENSNRSLSELLKKVEKTKEELEAKVAKVEDVQKEMKKEICMTKERLSQWERNLEVVSEGYGEEIVEPKQIISLSDLKDKLKQYLTEHCAQSSLDFNLVDEICKEGDRLQEEWKKEKCDLQQQIDVADKQVHSLKKFLEEQAVEREQEREAFDREINSLRESLRAKERDNSMQNRTNREVGRLSLMSAADNSVEALEAQLKELTARLTEAEKNKLLVEGEFQNAVKKIWSLREVIQDLEVQLAEVSERECNLRKKLERADTLIEEQSKANRSFKEELEAFRSQNELKYSDHIKALEDELMNLRRVADQVHPDSLTQLKASLRQIEAALIKKTKDLEQLHVSSTNVSCSSPSEDVSIRDHLDATRCSTPDEMCENVQPLSITLPTDEVDRIHEKLARHTRAEEVAMKYIRDLKMQLRNHRKAFEEVQTERDVLLEKVDLYLKENSSLKIRLEEQRCNAGLLQKQLNANLESQISRLEIDVEKLNDLCNEKDKQLRDLKEILENTTKSLKVREAEALNKSKEENTLITTLKTDLANALNENGKLEEKLEKTMEKLRETMKMPALIDSMLDEKNAEIDRLEKELAKLSSEKSSSAGTPRSCNNEEKHKRKIRFSEPESFSENISSISVHCTSDLRHCSDTSSDFRNSSFKIRRPIAYSTKLESVSSIAPLQLSPRGADYSFTWKSSSPILHSDSPVKSPPKTSPTKQDIEQMEEISKLQTEIESKQREISELNLEIDKLKRQLVEAKQEVDTAKSQTKEVQNELVGKDEEIRKLKNNEKSLLLSVESLKANHAEEVEELQSKLSFEHGKVEKVYEEIKALEVKKIEIEESFLSLREDYNEKINSEKRTSEALLERIRTLEAKNEASETREREIEKNRREMGQTIQTLNKEISRLKIENERNRIKSANKVHVATQVEKDNCVCKESLTLEAPKAVTSVGEDLDELKEEFEKMAAAIGEENFNKREAFSYAMAVRRLFSAVLSKVDELSKELESHVKKVMECSVDDLAVKVQKELVLSAKLDNQLLSSIEANGFAKETTPQPDSLDMVDSYREIGGGDNQFVVPKALSTGPKLVTICEEMKKKIGDLEKEKSGLEGKLKEQERVIGMLEESLKQEKGRILEEKDRCREDANIMELLRVNLEKGLQDIRAKEKELKKEKFKRISLEKELENYKKFGLKGWEGKKVMELNAQLESQKDKLVSIGKLLEDEKKKNQELRLALEEVKIERMSEKSTQRLLEGDLALLRDQKQNFKTELIKARKLLHARDVEIGLLKRKINLQEIDIKALSFSGIRPQDPSEASSTVSNGDLCTTVDRPTAVILAMKKLNSNVQRHVKESAEMNEALLYLSQETEEMKNIIRQMEERNEAKLAEETLVPDVEVERKLWTLEKGRLVMDLETLKRENEVLKHDLIDTCKRNECLKQENVKMKKENREIRSPKENGTNQMDCLVHQKRVSHLTRKYLRTESHRKALAWQKNYLAISLREYERSEEALRKMARKKKEVKRKVKKVRKFRVVALAVMAIFRMRFIVKRWKWNSGYDVLSLLDQQKLTAPTFGSPFDVYNEPPVDPLSYQTQNICRQSSSSQVLRTPPSRDPGPRGFSFCSKNPRGPLETYEYLQENYDIMKSLPCIFECLNE